jgi:ATP/maltotriose-dependent transcriptional regulator MalT
MIRHSGLIQVHIFVQHIDIKLSKSLQKVRISNVMQKLNVKGRSQAVVELVRLGELKI